MGSSHALAGRGAVGGEGQTDPVRLKSSSQSRTLQAVSKGPADSSVCLSEVSSSFLVSPRLLAEVDITHRGNKCASRSRRSPRMQIRATKAQMYPSMISNAFWELYQGFFFQLQGLTPSSYISHCCFTLPLLCEAFGTDVAKTEPGCIGAFRI